MKIYVLNIMTQDGETDGYDADDHVRAILEHAGPGVMDVCIANDAPVPPEIMEPYAKEGVSQLELRREDLEAGGITPHENTVQALNWYQGREKEYEKTTE